LKWVFSRGQEIAGAQGYATLPASVLSKVQMKAGTIR
jgi:hypothetical protein